jgi:hypothetical protein
VTASGSDTDAAGLYWTEHLLLVREKMGASKMTARMLHPVQSIERSEIAQKIVNKP